MHLGRTSKLQFTVLTTLAVLLLSGLGAQRAAANDLSTNPCTAGDVEILGRRCDTVATSGHRFRFRRRVH